ncbi:uncharacterized protein EAE98_002551 [Botrytis deweyae]|uniref:Uncharacterized protein n=1 Tax=Botrytis deweyae TaxID=2478750 RepID=A0ABQ7IXH8_9HELO|nr:uncharacterized protein EAE98_002551 [Botrytis deweyae]KAF7936332.1 hypothetical protein EAE98_002551 [Botrytis deweyae]
MFLTDTGDYGSVSKGMALVGWNRRLEMKEIKGTDERGCVQDGWNVINAALFGVEWSAMRRVLFISNLLILYWL